MTRKQTTRLLLSAVSTAALALTVSACSDESGSSTAENCTWDGDYETIEEGKLAVGVSDMPPQSNTTGPEGMGGIDAELIRLFAEQECLDIDVVTGASSAMIPGVEQGRTDVALGGWNRTEDRAEIVSLSAPLYIDPLAIVSEDAIDEIAELEGKVIGTVDGFHYVESLREVFGSDLKLYPSPENMAQDLSAGRIDAAIDGAIAATVTYDLNEFTNVIARPDERIPATIEPAQGSLVFNIDNEDLTSAFNEFVAEVKESGEYEEILIESGIDPSVLETGEPRFL